MIVNSWNEWDPLRHVIVGRAEGCCIPPGEPASEPKIPLDSDMRGMYGPRSSESVYKATEQLDNFCSILESRGITVDRPVPIEFDQAIATPDWEHGSMFGCQPPRDVILTVGTEMLEATMSYRSRWFEYLCYRPLLQRYFEEDSAMRHEAAPKPRLTANSYKNDYLSDEVTIETRLQMVAEKNFVTTEEEILFDAADVLRFGRDIFVQHGFTTNLRGINWLQRHFSDLRVHALNFPGDPYPIHIDASFTPIKPGFLLNNPDRPLPKRQRKIFSDNDWEIFEAARPLHNTPPPLCYSSVWLSMNVLVLDPKTVCVESSETATCDQLDGLGMNVLPIPFRDAYAFGGGLHCATTDVYREGNCMDYFPNQKSRLFPDYFVK